jgi:uncharacterized protein
MGSGDNADLVRRGYAAFSTGDIATLSELFADDAVWHVPGSGSLSGAMYGRDAILAFFGELMARSAGTIKITLHYVIGGDEHRVALHHEFAVSGSYRLDQNAANIFHVRTAASARCGSFTTTRPATPGSGHSQGAGTSRAAARETASGATLCELG